MSRLLHFKEQQKLREFAQERESEVILQLSINSKFSVLNGPNKERHKSSKDNWVSYYTLTTSNIILNPGGISEWFHKEIIPDASSQAISFKLSLSPGISLIYLLVLSHSDAFPWLGLLYTVAFFVNFCPKILASILILMATILFEFKKFNSKEYEIKFYHDFKFLKSDQICRV